MVGDKTRSALHMRIKDTRFELKELGFVAEHSGIEVAKYSGLELQRANGVGRIINELTEIKNSFTDATAESGSVLAFATGLMDKNKALYARMCLNSGLSWRVSGAGTAARCRSL